MIDGQNRSSLIRFGINYICKKLIGLVGWLDPSSSFATALGITAIIDVTLVTLLCHLSPTVQINSLSSLGTLAVSIECELPISQVLLRPVH